MGSTTILSTRQEQERAILQEKLDGLLDRKAMGNQAVFEKIETEARMLEDFITPLGVGSPLSFMNVDGEVKMQVESGEVYGLHDHAQYQLGEKMGVPPKYLMGLNSSEWGRDLAVEILEEHKKNIARERVLVRVVGDQARAFLSDRYKRMDSTKIYEAFIKGMNMNGAVIYDAMHTETKGFVNAVLPRVIEIPTENNGVVFSVFGARMSNSDFGDGALDVRAFQMNVVCLNGMVGESMFKKIHLGGRITESLELSNRTYQLNSETMASAIKDISEQVLSSDVIMANAQKIQSASAKLIDVDKELKKLPKMGILKDEVEQVKTKLMESNPDDGVIGKPSLWKLSQALTSVSNDVAGKRKQELDEIAGKLIL